MGSEKAASSCRQSSQNGHAEPGEPPAVLQRQRTCDAHAVKAPQTGHDVGEQSRGDQIAADHPHGATDQRQGDQLDEQHGGQRRGRHPAGSKGAHHWQTLLEGEADSRMHDEEADDKRQQAKGGQVEMETFG